jgi:hypothetical protein
MTAAIGIMIGAIAGVVILGFLGWIFGFLLTAGIAAGGVLLPTVSPSATILPVATGISWSVGPRSPDRPMAR